MIKEINIKAYKKLKNIKLEFSKKINIISGTNGTCKTSLLHIISNSFQEVNKGCDWLKNQSCLPIIKKLNKITNAKIETLNKGDKIYNNPAPNEKGSLFTINYYNHASMDFRRHNSKSSNRYSIKPYYKVKQNDSLPFCPVIYLGLTRLFPFGEYQNEEQITNLNINLPEDYKIELINLYNLLTGISIDSYNPQIIGDFKSRHDFSSKVEGIDSNTISAGEENLLILLTSIVSLKYYSDCYKDNQQKESVLLIDEIDATLHPSLMFKFLNVLEDYCDKYSIQIVCTTHSLALIEYVIEKKMNLIYLIDNINSIVNMACPDIFKIKMYLNNLCHTDIYANKKIPIFSEDEQARDFINILFEYFYEKNDDFKLIRNYFYLVEASIGATVLRGVFKDEYLLKSSLQSICILDGDQSEDKNFDIICLPGDESPETMIMKYAIILFEKNESFWEDQSSQSPMALGYTKVFFRDTILPDIKSIEEKISRTTTEGKTTKGMRRELNKKIYTDHNVFFKKILKYWVHDSENKEIIDRFYNNIIIMYKKTALYHGLNPKIFDSV